MDRPHRQQSVFRTAGSGDAAEPHTPQRAVPAKHRAQIAHRKRARRRATMISSNMDALLAPAALILSVTTS